MSAGWETLLTGRVLAERYAMEQVIGRGGMSVVYRATDRVLGRAVAVKVIAHPAASDEGRKRLRARFRREASAAAGIPPHPNVVHIYDYGTDPELDLDFIVMELLRGQDLKLLLAESGLDRPQAARVLLEAARGLAAGHRAGIVHRDVKPANIFLVGAPQLEGVRVLDFGIAKALDVEDDLTLAGEAPPHSPAYASPELLDAARRLTPASDVYQLGLVAYEMLAGERPFTEEERDRNRSGAPVPLPARGAWLTLPAGVRRVIERSLAPDPHDRFADAAVFAEALARALEETPGDPLPPSAAVPGPLPAPHAMAYEDATLLDDDEARAAAPRPAPVGVEVPARSAAEVRPAAWHPGNTVKAMVGVMVLVALIWVGARLLGGERDAGEAGPAEVDVAALDDEFRELQHAAALLLLEGEATSEGAEAAEQVQRVILDLYQSYADADLNRHVAHYAARVDFYGRSRVRRSTILQERRRERNRYDEVDLTLERQAIEFPAPDRARALVDQSWRLRGPQIRWDGASRQEMVLELRQGRWVITAEETVETYRSDCVGC
jgi:predicted Ser/Thr protein kinase